MKDLEKGALSGQYYAPSEEQIINLASVTKLWHQDDGFFSKKDRLYYTSCGEDSHISQDKQNISSLFNSLANDGSFVQIGEKLINTKSIQSAHYDGRKIRYQLAGEDYSLKLNTVDAKDILNKLRDLKRFSDIRGYVINMNKVVNMYGKEAGFLSNDRLKINFLGQAGLSIDMPLSETKQHMSVVLERPQFKMVENEIVNVAVAGCVWIKGDELRIAYPGTDCYVKLNSGAGDALNHFSAEAGYVTVAGEKINPKIIGRTWKDEGGWLSSPKLHFNMLGKDNSIKCDSKVLTNAMSGFEQTGDFVLIGEDLVNINSIGRAYYESGKLCFTQGAEDYTEKMPKRDAEIVLNSILQHQNFVKVNQQTVNAQFCGVFNYEDGKLECMLGREAEKFKMSQDEATKILSKVKEIGISKKRELSSMRDGADGAAFDSDLLAEIYEEIDTMHTTNVAVMAAVYVTVINPSVST